MASEVCELPDGRRIRYFLKKRKGRPCYFACFRGPDNKRHESSTSERNRKRAQESANARIRTVFVPMLEFVEWDEAIDLATRHMRANNLRRTTIQQYELAVSTLRKAFAQSEGPADITPAMAEEFKIARLEKGRKPRTVENDIGNLNIVYGHWFRDTLKIIADNPFADVEPPRYDKVPPRYVAQDEQQALFNWLGDRWAWRLPVLFLEVKAAIGCRIGELSAALTTNLRDGRLYFLADTTKGREERACLLPPALFDELRATAGPIYVFERYSEQLRAIHATRGHLLTAAAVQDFSPARLKRWIQDETKTYFDKTKARKFKLHNFRGTAMSKARIAGVAVDDAAVAFDCNPDTMREHYLAFDRAKVADGVFTQMQNGGAGGGARNGNGGAVGAQEPAQKEKDSQQLP